MGGGQREMNILYVCQWSQVIQAEVHGQKSGGAIAKENAR